MACRKCTIEDVDGTCVHEVMAAIRADREEAITCPTCGGEAGEMGSLGRRKHYRCRACGMQFSSEEKS